MAIVIQGFMIGVCQFFDQSESIILSCFKAKEVREDELVSWGIVAFLDRAVIKNILTVQRQEINVLEIVR